jgi:hypothetical protein
VLNLTVFSSFCFLFECYFGCRLLSLCSLFKDFLCHII